MLRNYKKKSSMNEWCSKSTLVQNMNFCTPEPLSFHHSESESYASMCSKLVSLAIFNELNDEDMASLKTDLEVIESKKPERFSEGMQLLTDLIKSYPARSPMNSELMFVYNSLLAPFVRKNNEEWVKIMINKLFFYLCYYV